MKSDVQKWRAVLPALFLCLRFASFWMIEFQYQLKGWPSVGKNVEKMMNTERRPVGLLFPSTLPCFHRLSDQTFAEASWLKEQEAR